MTTQEFFNQYNGKGVDFDGYYGFQCMDLAEQYNKDVVGAPRLGGNAADVWDHYPTDKYDKIANTPNNAPQLGDIIIWGRTVGGGFGHIAIVQTATISSFTSMDQNWPAGSIAHFQQHNYTSVLGWLRPKVIVPPVDPRDKQITDLQAKLAKAKDLAQQICNL